MGVGTRSYVNYWPLFVHIFLALIRILCGTYCGFFWASFGHKVVDINIFYHFTQIWLPDMTLYNMVGPMTHLVETNAIIMSSGLILNFPYISVEVRLNID